MRALFVIHNPAYGGAHNEILGQRAGLEAAGWELVTATCSEPSTGADRLSAAGLEVLRLPLHRLRATVKPRPHVELVASFPFELASLRRLIARRGVDLVQVHGLTNPHAAVAGRLGAAGVCWHLYETLPPAALRRSLPWLVSRLAGSVTVTGEATARAHPGIDRLGERLVITFPPVDAQRYRNDPAARAAARAELGVADGALVIGTVGNRNPAKGHDLLIEAAALLMPRLPQAEVLVLGAVSPGHPAYERRLADLVAAHGLQARLRFVDPADRVAELLPALDIFAFPSRSEGMPAAVLEAMACELPVVASDVGATGEEVVDGVTGLLVPAGDSRALADAITRLGGDASERVRMGQAGRQRVSGSFTPERAVANRLRAWELAVARRRTA